MEMGMEAMDKKRKEGEKRERKRDCDKARETERWR